MNNAKSFASKFFKCALFGGKGRKHQNAGEDETLMSGERAYTLAAEGQKLLVCRNYLGRRQRRAEPQEVPINTN